MFAATREPPLSRTLSAILPRADQTCLLRACLGRGRSASRSWSEWWDRAGSCSASAASTRDVNVLLPLLFDAQRRERFPVSPEFRDRLQAAFVREKLRWQAYRDICRAALSALSAGRLPVLVLKGAALAETAWSRPHLRHTHDIDLLVHPDDLPRAAQLLTAAGFHPQPTAGSRSPHDAYLVHPSGLPLHLHDHLFRLAYYRADLSPVWSRARLADVAGVLSRVLTPADTLFHVCLHASSTRSRGSLKWVCDAWFLIQRRGLDWDLLLETTRAARASLPLYVTLGYLARELAAPVPSVLLDRLREAACRTDATGQFAALYGARCGPGGSTRKLLRHATGTRERLLMLTRLLFPPPNYLRWTRPACPNWLLPFHYLVRPGRYALKRLLRPLVASISPKSPPAAPSP